MSANNMLMLPVAAAAGGLLGLFFFGGLWWTVHRAFDSPRPAMWVGGSLLLRLAFVIAGFVVVSADDWRRALSCLLGFWVGRWLAVRRATSHPVEPSNTLCLPIGSANEHSINDETIEEDGARHSRSGAP